MNNLIEALNFAETLVYNRPAFSALPGMKYFLIDEVGRVHGSGRIESVHPEWGAVDNGAPIDNGWLPDLRDSLTLKMCVGMFVMNPIDPFDPYNN
tara:strand:+ start:47 stop:331 length:285 start_codon:yes stop_codon:yes gene_type:complete